MSMRRVLTLPRHGRRLPCSTGCLTWPHTNSPPDTRSRRRSRASRIKWRDYVYAKSPDLAAARTEAPVFDRLPDVAAYQLPAGYALASPISGFADKVAGLCLCEES